MKTVREALNALEGGWFTNNKKVLEVQPRMVEREWYSQDGKTGGISILGFANRMKLLRLTDASAKRNGGKRWKVSW